MKKRNSPLIILLNGPSSSGKSTLANMLQEKFQEPFLHIGIDKMIGMMPSSINNWEGGESEQGFWWKQSVDPDGHPIFEIQLGPYAKKMSDTYKEVVVALARNGHNVIVDEVAFGNEALIAWREKLKEFRTIYIGVESSLPTLEERERARGDRIIGSARHQYYTVHQNIIYDLSVDTEKESSEACAEKIIKFVSKIGNIEGPDE